MSEVKVISGLRVETLLEITHFATFSAVLENTTQGLEKFSHQPEY